MDPPRFVDHYRPLLGWLRTCGLSTPWGEKPSFAWRLIIACYNTLLVIMVCYMLFLYIYPIMKNSIPFAELCLLGNGFALLGCSLAITLYLVLFKGKLKVIIENMDSIADIIHQNELGGAVFLQEMYKKNARLMKVLTNNSIYFGFLTPVIFCWSVPTMGWFSGNYRANLPIQIDSPYDYHIPLVYELMVLLLSCCLAVSTTKKAATDCLFMSLFNIQITFLKYLSITKSYIQDDFRSTNKAIVKRKLIIWIRLHQQINLNIQQLVAIFSPLVILYSVAIIIIVVCGAFVQIMNDSNNLIQSMSIGIYVAMTFLYQFLMSRTADELTHEAMKLAFFAYDLPWYEMKRADADMVRMVILRSNRPIQVTAYCAPIFMLNRETFRGFMVTSISAFVTFCQIKDRYG
ncbi:odorant receptor 10 [Halyomorpha halys]|uniref:odorant receptor 10 n=1 Tax=Halyomorpha halys TaxID=286706 RepID=UPI0034D1A93F|nr:Odorant receptor 92 [Halyomorpha halys]